MRGSLTVIARQWMAAANSPLIRPSATFSLRAKSRLRRLRSDTRLRAQPLGGGEGIFYWFSPAATTAASAMELTFVWKESLRLVRMAGTLVPVRMQPFLQSAVWTSVL